MGIDASYFLPLAGIAVSGVRYGMKGASAVGARWGFFGGREIVPNGSPLRAHIEANIAASKAASESSNYVTFSKRATARTHYANGGWASERITSHLDGIDFSRTITEEIIPKGTILQQHQMPGDPIGNYFTLFGADRAKLGIYTSGRTTRNYMATSDIRALRSTTADITDFWSMMKYKWKIMVRGGETQYFTHDVSSWRIVP